MKKIPVYAWYFPNWHPGDPLNEQWHGKGWSEWRCVQYAAQRFEGHTIYHPLWGYEDESDPKVMGKKIDTALEYGVDGFMWDFYWFESTGGYRLKALDAFCEAMKTRKNFKMALMWCNHDPMYVHPASYLNRGRELLSGDLSAEGFAKGADYIIEKCMTQDWYMTVQHEGKEKLYFVIWALKKLADGLGGVENARRVLDAFRDKVRKVCGKELYLATYPTSLPGYGNGKPEEITEYLKAFGIDGCITYGWPVRPDEGDEWPVVQYSRFVDNGIETFEKYTKNVNLPVNITVEQGWDSSPRTVPSDMHEQHLGFPYNWITDHKNPADFKRGLAAAKEFFRSDASTGDFITLSTWNEWTEGNFMEPSVEQGYAYLEAVRDVFGTQEKPL